MKKINVETFQVEGIPVMTLAQENAANCPVVFYVHGFTGDKLDGLPLGYRLASRGFYCVSLDAYMHGERIPPNQHSAWEPDDEDLLYPAGTGVDTAVFMYQVVAQTVQDVGTLIAHFEHDARADTRRLGIAGASMGAAITYCLAANDPRFQVAVPLAGMPAFTERMQDVIIECSSYNKWSRIFENRQPAIETMLDFLRSLDPFEKMQDFCPKPLMMINGEHDLDAPKIYSIRLYEHLKPFYAQQPERLRLNIHDGVGHEVSKEMLADACDWFSKYLLEPREE